MKEQNDMAVISERWDGVMCALFDETTGDGPAHYEDKRRTDDGDIYVICGGRAPHKSSSTGKVFCAPIDGEFERTLYPGVLGLEWKPI